MEAWVVKDYLGLYMQLGKELKPKEAEKKYTRLSRKKKRHGLPRVEDARKRLAGLKS